LIGVLVLTTLFSYLDISLGVLGSISPTCLHTAFTRADPKSAKQQSTHKCIFALLGSTCIKAAHKTLMKLTVGL